jgi:hypothetical protein
MFGHPCPKGEVEMISHKFLQIQSQKMVKEIRVTLTSPQKKVSCVKDEENNSMPCMLIIQVMHSKPCTIKAGYLKMIG